MAIVDIQWQVVDRGPPLSRLFELKMLPTCGWGGGGGGVGRGGQGGRGGWGRVQKHVFSRLLGVVICFIYYYIVHFIHN